MDVQKFIEQFGSFTSLQELNLILMILKRVGLRDVLASGALLSKAFKTAIETKLKVGYSSNDKQYLRTVYNYDNQHVYGLQYRHTPYNEEVLDFDNLTTNEMREFSFKLINRMKPSLTPPTGFIANGTFILLYADIRQIQAYNVKTGEVKRFDHDAFQYVKHISWNKERQAIALVYWFDDDWLLKGLFNFGVIFWDNLTGKIKLNYDYSSNDIPTFPRGGKYPIASVSDELYIRVTVGSDKHKLVILNLPSKIVWEIKLKADHLPVVAEVYDSYILLVTLSWEARKLNYLFYRKDWILINQHSFSLDKMPGKFNLRNLTFVKLRYINLPISDRDGDFFITTSENKVIEQTLILTMTKAKIKSPFHRLFEQMSFEEQKISSKLVFQNSIQFTEKKLLLAEPSDVDNK